MKSWWGIVGRLSLEIFLMVCMFIAAYYFLSPRAAMPPPGAQVVACPTTPSQAVISFRPQQTEESEWRQIDPDKLVYTQADKNAAPLEFRLAREWAGAYARIRIEEGKYVYVFAVSQFMSHTFELKCGRSP